MESSVAIALSQLKQMTKDLMDDKKLKIIAAQKAIACGQVRPISKELNIAPSTIRRYRKKLLVGSDSSDSMPPYSCPEEAIEEEPVTVKEETVRVKEEVKPALKFTIEVRPTGKSLVCQNCKNSIDIKNLCTTKNPATDQNFQL